MSFSSRRRNYLLSPHRRDGLVEWMKSMLEHSFVLDSLDATAADTFSHFEALIEEHRQLQGRSQPSRLQQLIPTVGIFHTKLPLRAAFGIYNNKHRLTKRKHIQISFNEVRRILNLAQIMALRKEVPGKHVEDLMASTRGTAADDSEDSIRTVSTTEGEDDSSDCSRCTDSSSATNIVEMFEKFNGPRLVTFDADQALYKSGEGFVENESLMRCLELLLCNGVTVAFLTSDDYEYNTKEYNARFSGLLRFFAEKQLGAQECERFFVLAGECNYLLRLDSSDYQLHPVKERSHGGWIVTTKFIKDAPGNWEEEKVQELLNAVELEAINLVEDLGLVAVADIVRSSRAVGVVPCPGLEIPRETLDEIVLCFQEKVEHMNCRNGPGLPYCAFNGGSETWLTVGSKRVGVQILQHYLGVSPEQMVHLGDQFLNDPATAGNAYAATAVSPCLWVTDPQESTYILKSILRLSGVHFQLPESIAFGRGKRNEQVKAVVRRSTTTKPIDFSEMQRRKQLTFRSNDRGEKPRIS